jgi:predicted phosphodiesterase
VSSTIRCVCAALLVALVATSCSTRESGRERDVALTPSATPTASPGPPEPLRFAVIGDWGSGWPSQHAVADRMCAWREERPFDLVMTTGDNIYPDGSQQHFQRKFFTPYDCLLRDGVRFHAALGNHDFVTDRGGDELDEPAFGMPKRNYVLRQNGVRFVVWDSNVMDREWLSRATRARALDRWTIVLFHHPVYSPGPQRGSTPGFRPSLPRLFRARGVDLVLNGHDHIYSATKPLRRIRYVVTGGGGASLYPCGEAWFSVECQSRNHFLYVVVHPDHIGVRAVPTVGHPFHRFQTTGR